MRRGAVIAVLLMLMPTAAIATDAARAAAGGAKWTIATTPNPRGVLLAELNSVSCTSTSHCVAVGDSFAGSTEKALIEQWDGHHWRLMAGRNKPGSVNTLNDVACLGPTNCFAVGYFSTPHHTDGALIEHWDGRRWAIMPTAKVFGSTGATLSGVACPLVNSCFAVGSFAAHGHGIVLIEHWDGKRWSVVPSRTPYDTFAALADVSCGSTDRCVAVGTIEFNGRMQPLIARFNGQIWQTMTSAKPQSPAGLINVSCSAPTNCFAVGFRSGSPVVTTLMERWNGARWQIVSTPGGKGTFVNALSGVSCTSPTSCYAVGSNSTKVRTKTLVERWDGARWRIMASPNVRGAGSILTGVACPRPARCFAVGSAKKTLVERLR